MDHITRGTRNIDRDRTGIGTTSRDRLRNRTITLTTQIPIDRICQIGDRHRIHSRHIVHREIVCHRPTRLGHRIGCCCLDQLNSRHHISDRHRSFIVIRYRVPIIIETRRCHHIRMHVTSITPNKRAERTRIGTTNQNRLRNRTITTRNRSQIPKDRVGQRIDRHIIHRRQIAHRKRERHQPTRLINRVRRNRLHNLNIRRNIRHRHRRGVGSCVRSGFVGCCSCDSVCLRVTWISADVRGEGA